MKDTLSNWEAVFICGRKERRVVSRSPPPIGVLRFNVDKADRGKPGIAGVLHNFMGEAVLMLSKNVDVKEFNEAEVMEILEALRLFSCSFRARLIVESDSGNVVQWVSNIVTRPWRFHFHFNEIKELSSHLDVFFSYE